MLCALIMAGGKGTRFWPMSTDEKPKQFLSLVEDRTMIQMTIERILPIIPIERIFVCTGEKYIKLVKEQLPELPEKNIIVEPQGRNTAPCIALSALVIKRYYNDSTMIVLPSDHVIENEDKFRLIIEDATKFIGNNKNAIVTLGIKPDRPECGYGYIKCADNVNGENIFKVDRFVEKPNEEKANEYLREGSYLWNGGMFLWNTENIITQIREYLPRTYEALAGLQDVKEGNLQAFINNNYRATDAISIDYGILEKSKDIYVVPSDIGWDDVGVWESLERYRDVDSDGNVILGQSTNIQSTNNIVISQNNNVIINKLSGIYVIENNGKIIIGNKEEINEINHIRNMI